jgi:hypothetical protein
MCSYKPCHQAAAHGSQQPPLHVELLYVAVIRRKASELCGDHYQAGSEVCYDTVGSSINIMATYSSIKVHTTWYDKASRMEWQWSTSRATGNFLGTVCPKLHLQLTRVKQLRGSRAWSGLMNGAGGSADVTRSFNRRHSSIHEALQGAPR